MITLSELSHSLYHLVDVLSKLNIINVRAY